MVTGLDTFRRHFAGYEDAFVLIGGAACDFWFTRAGFRFRATRDLDLVLILEAAQDRFYAHFWAFVRAGGYEVAQRSTGERTFFRFQKPTIADYPAMIELLASAPPAIEPFPGQTIVPIPAGEDISSLSAILLNPDYYAFVLGQRDLVDGLPLIRPAGLIALKAHAWLDLTRRQGQGDATVKQDDISKHRSDVFRLAALLPTGETITVPEVIVNDLRNFLSRFPPDSADWPAILQSLAATGIRLPTTTLLAAITTYFGLTPEAPR